MAEFEYCVMRPDDPQDPHRGPMTRDEAIQWVREWEEMAENSSARRGFFYVARRMVSRWEAYS